MSSLGTPDEFYFHFLSRPARFQWRGGGGGWGGPRTFDPQPARSGRLLQSHTLMERRRGERLGRRGGRDIFPACLNIPQQQQQFPRREAGATLRLVERRREQKQWRGKSRSETKKESETNQRKQEERRSADEMGVGDGATSC